MTFRVSSSILALVMLFIMLVDVAWFNSIGDRANLISDLISTGGTGRAGIWWVLITSVLENPLSFLFGVGSVSQELYGSQVTSAHSIFVYMFYVFGVFGFLGLIVFLLWIFVSVCGSKAEDKGFRLSLLAMFSLGMLIDSYILNAQTFWFSSLIIAYLAGGGECFPMQPKKATLR
ncbi:hypothetical protein NBRC116492_28210 [Aurantivibrio infirmus]